MPKYKINKNKKPVSDKEIEKHRDFSKIIDEHKKLTRYHKAVRPIYKDRKFLMFIMLIVVVLMAIYFSEHEPVNEMLDLAPEK